MAYKRKDGFYRRAKAQGLRSRAAFKLEDVARDLLRPGHRVVDLGCWPGGWSQVAGRWVGSGGLVIGVDLRPVREPVENVVFLQGDVADSGTRAEILARLGSPADLVLSDMAPQLTGIQARDAAQTAAVSRAALEAAQELLRPGGDFLLKAFVNEALGDLERHVRAAFQRVRTTRPPSTRKGSSEIYFLARGLRGPT